MIFKYLRHYIYFILCGICLNTHSIGEKLDIDSLMNRVNVIEEKVYNDNSVEVGEEILNTIALFEEYYKTERKLNAMHIYSYILYAIHNFDYKIHKPQKNFSEEKIGYKIALDYCDKAISMLDKNKISKYNPVYIYAENIRAWCIYYLGLYDSPFKIYDFSEWYPIILENDDVCNYTIFHNEDKSRPSLLEQLYTNSRDCINENKAEEALLNILTAKAIYESSFDIKNDYYYDIILFAAKIYAKLGHFDEAILYTDIFIKHYANDTGHASKAFVAIASSYQENYKAHTILGKELKKNITRFYKDENIKDSKHNLNKVRRFYGENSQSYVDALIALTNLYYFNGMKLFWNENSKEFRNNKKRNTLILDKTINAMKSLIQSQFPLMTSSYRQQLIAKHSAFIEYGFSYTSMLCDSGEQLYNGLLLYKGLVLNSYTAMNNSIDIDTLKTEEDKLYYAIDNNYMNFISHTWKDIAKNMTKSMVAIEFWKFPGISNCDMYCACLIRHDYKKPIIIPLFNENEFNNIKSSSFYSSCSLYNLIWGKLEQYINQNDNIFFSTIGILNNIGLESLIDDNGNIASDKWTLYRVSSTREILNKNSKYIPYSSSVFYGWINYNSKNTKTIGPSLEFIDESSQARSSLMRNSFKNLPYTKFEIENITNLLKDKNLGYKIYERDLASEESFKNLSGKKNTIIHIATHGFYNKEKDTLNINVSEIDSIESTIDRSMKNSGLIFCGVNKILNDSTIQMNDNDGILTAYEISKIDLSGCEQVILSACNTALGDIYTCEGVLGLQRGFKLAGVRSILMSLWEVDDKATQILMQKYYQNYLNGHSKINALKLAQRYVSSLEGFSDPKYWAGFILLDAVN